MPGILFPHSTIPVSMIENVTGFFGDVKMCQPWYMVPPEFMKGESIEVIYPPESHKPGKDFQSLLSEYRQWAAQNRDKSYLEIFKRNRDEESTDHTTWEIRRLINQGVQSVSDTDKGTLVTYHLLLHLAREIEEQHAEMDRLLKGLKRKDSLLKGSIEKVDERQGLLEDLPLFEQEPVFNDENLEQIFRAWIGLFGEYLKGNEPLITFNRRILDYISGIWDPLLPEDKDLFRSIIELKVPCPPQQSSEEQGNSRGKYHPDKRIAEIKALVYQLHEDPARNLKELNDRCKDFHHAFPWESAERTFKISLKYLHPVSENGADPSNEIVSRLFDHAIILMEE